MAELKTQRNDADVSTFLEGLDDPVQRDDARTLIEIMRAATGEEPQMWGTSIIGFGSYHYEYASGRQGDWFRVGFSPRKRNLTLYIMPGFERYGALLARLGKHKTGKSCLYVSRLAVVDLEVIKELVHESVVHLQEKRG